MHIVITYCKPCGYEKRAQDLAQSLLRELGVQPTLAPGKGGIFDVAVDGRSIAKKTRDGFLDAAMVLRTLQVR
jgi:selenoprotein W-related protein